MNAGWDDDDYDDDDDYGYYDDDDDEPSGSDNRPDRAPQAVVPVPSLVSPTAITAPQNRAQVLAGLKQMSAVLTELATRNDAIIQSQSRLLKHQRVFAREVLERLDVSRGNVESMMDDIDDMEFGLYVEF